MLPAVQVPHIEELPELDPLVFLPRFLHHQTISVSIQVFEGLATSQVILVTQGRLDRCLWTNTPITVIMKIALGRPGKR